MTGLYTTLAEYYDTMYSFKDYRSEAARVMGIARRNGRARGREWLDVPCGTGRHLEYIARRYRCTGLDASPAMLRIARRRLPRVRLVRGDMRSFRLGRQFDVVTSLFSGIGHVLTVAGLRRTINTFARHLKPGGVLVVEPWFTKQTWHPGMVHLLTAGGPDLRIARMSYSTVRGRVSVLNMHFLIAQKGKGVRYALVTERAGLFDPATTLRLLRAAGLRPRFLKRGLSPGRGLFIATRPAAPPQSRRRRA
jgi:ubiquinone/menaquinone biosynthesis C-methylase UbiE